MSKELIPNISYSPVFVEMKAEHLIDDTKILKQDINRTSYSTDFLYEEWFGEAPLSYRSMLKRYGGSASLQIPATTGYQSGYTFSFYNIPSIVQVGNLMSYLRPGFLAMRGSVKKMLNFPSVYSSTTSTTKFDVGDMVVVALPFPNKAIALPTPSSFAGNSYTDIFNYTGTIEFSPANNSGVEFEIPYYSTNLFYSSQNGNNQTPASNTLYDQFGVFWYNVCITPTSTPNNGTLYIQEYTAAGEDFTMMGYTGAPVYTTL
jgi:hypothetical protein